MKIKYRWAFAIIYSIFLVGLTTYIALDTFVIERSYTKVKKEEKTKEVIKQLEELTEPIITDTSYEDENIKITIEKYQEYDSDIYVANIEINDISYLQTAFAKDSYGRNIIEKTSVIASNNGAILAINGDYYGAKKKGYVLKNGVIYRDTSRVDQEDLAIYENGDFELIVENEVDIKTLLNEGVYNLLAFGPGMVNDNKIIISPSDTESKAQIDNPRAAIGKIDDGYYIFVVVDGRTEESVGMTLYELAEFMCDLGVDIGYNLDGGGSATMYFNGKVINKPTTNGKDIKERSISDIVYVGY